MLEWLISNKLSRINLSISLVLFFVFIIENARSKKQKRIWIRLTTVLVNARANIKQQTWTVGQFQELIFSVCMCVIKKWKFGRRIVKTLCTYFQFNSIKCIIYFQYNSVKIASFSFYFPFSFIQLGSCSSQSLVSFCPFIGCFLLFYKTYL